MKHENILVVGGSGFVGRHLVARLAAEGRRVTVPTRRRERAKHLLMLPTVDLVEADIHDDAALAALVAGKDAVVNLVGILHGSAGTPYGPEFKRAHVDLPQRIARTCAAAGVKRFLHMSALGADPAGPSMYLRSKGDGERAAASEPALDVTVFRPSVVFGPEDRFLNLFASLQALFWVMPLANAGARLQPIYVGDVAQAMVNALDNESTYDKTYELAGPAVYTLAQLVRFAGEASGHPRPILPLPDFAGRIQALVLELMPGETLMSRDNLDSIKTPNVAHAPIAEELGIEPVAMEAIAPAYLAGNTVRARHSVRRADAHR